MIDVRHRQARPRKPTGGATTTRISCSISTALLSRLDSYEAAQPGLHLNLSELFDNALDHWLAEHNA